MDRETRIRSEGRRLGVPEELVEELVSSGADFEVALAHLPRLAESAALSRQQEIERFAAAQAPAVVPADMVQHLVVGRLPADAACQAIEEYVRTGEYRGNGVYWHRSE